MTTKEAEAIIELAGRYWRNQWTPGASSEESRETILDAARVLLGAETTDTGEKRWTITVCRTCWEYRPYSELCSCWYRDPISPDPIDVEVVPLDRAEKAEAAAKDLAEALMCAREALGWIAPWEVPRSKWASRNEALASAREALARHPEYAPDHDFLPGETSERYPPKP